MWILKKEKNPPQNWNPKTHKDHKKVCMLTWDDFFQMNQQSNISQNWKDKDFSHISRMDAIRIPVLTLIRSWRSVAMFNWNDDDRKHSFYRVTSFSGHVHGCVFCQRFKFFLKIALKMQSCDTTPPEAFPLITSSVRCLLGPISCQFHISSFHLAMLPIPHTTPHL